LEKGGEGGFINSFLDDPTRRGGSGVTGIGSARGFDNQNVHLFLRHRTMLNSFRRDKQISWTELYLAVAQLDREIALEHEEYVVCFVVFMPSEMTA
jgi:hypothetical protein